MAGSRSGCKYLGRIENLRGREIMSGKLLGLRRRLARVERTLANIAKREEMADCICQEMTVVMPDQPEKFEAEMNRTCPVHGFRRLEAISCESDLSRWAVLRKDIEKAFSLKFALLLCS